ncbi:MAG: hypothetical protein L3J59_11190 [Methylococcaceae bacterium]|nr:hypothetical protein [Methylococcaceae bacterium]
MVVLSFFYTVEGEVLTTTQDGFNKPAIGSRITLEPDIDYHSGNASSVDLHSMDAVNDTLLHQQLMLGCNASPL